MFPNRYTCLKKQAYRLGEYSLVPIRYEDRWDIMQWRNQQMYHLRQNHLLTSNDQENYFSQTIAKLFSQEQPAQILFSYLKNGQCIAYGGLVHINWIDRHAEISFLMNTELEGEEFMLHWKNYLWLLEEVAFEQLNFHKIFTYAYNLRPKLYEALTKAGFKEEARLSGHCHFEGKFIDVLIHSKFNPYLHYRLFNENDKQFIFDLNNDEISRENSFYPKTIGIEEHAQWFSKRLNDPYTCIYIVEKNNEAIGIVRFQREGNQSTVGINILKGWRSMGLAKRILKQACTRYLEENDVEILAYIKPANTASVKTFEYANFSYLQRSNVNGFDALVYNLKSDEE